MIEGNTEHWMHVLVVGYDDIPLILIVNIISVVFHNAITLDSVY